MLLNISTEYLGEKARIYHRKIEPDLSVTWKTGMPLGTDKSKVLAAQEQGKGGNQSLHHSAERAQGVAD